MSTMSTIDRDAKFADENFRRFWIKKTLEKIISNEGAKEVISWILFDALGDKDRAVHMNIAWVGPAGAGKTTFSKVFAQALCVPFVEIGPDKHITSVIDLKTEIVKVLKENGLVTPEENHFTTSLKFGPKGLILPSMVILLDEVHELERTAPGVIQALLKATEINDGSLVAGRTTFDCRNVCWHFATTELGEMFDPFVTRFEQIRLRLYTKEEIALIIHSQNLDLDMSVCNLISSYCNRIPREALRFTQLVKKARHSLSELSWEQVVAKVAAARGIDEFGMTEQRLNILRALGQRPMSVVQLCASAACKPKELQKFVLPWLLESTPDQEPYVVTANKHYITAEGLKELDKRGISHKGESVLCSADRD